MKKIKILVLFLLILFIGCQNIEFIYKDDKSLNNPIYNLIKYSTSGDEIPYLNRYLSSYFGRTDNPKYLLSLTIKEAKIKKSVKKNQVTEKLDYEIEVKFNLTNIEKSCLVNSKNIFSRFSYVPKSSGYNFGSDKSLDNLYKLSANESLSKYINYISGEDLTSCINEN